jgi:transposase
MNKKYNITANQAVEVRSVLKDYEKTTIFRKLQAIMLIGEGKSVKDVAAISLYSETYLYELIKQFSIKGLDEFAKDNRGGAHHKNLTDEQELELLAGFDKKAKEGKVVSLQKLKKEYDKACGKNTANSTFYAFLERMDWRKVKPRGAHPKKASEADIEASKKLTLR